MIRIDNSLVRVNVSATIAETFDDVANIKRPQRPGVAEPIDITVEEHIIPLGMTILFELVFIDSQSKVDRADQIIGQTILLVDRGGQN